MQKELLLLATFDHSNRHSRLPACYFLLFKTFGGVCCLFILLFICYVFHMYFHAIFWGAQPCIQQIAAYLLICATSFYCNTKALFNALYYCSSTPKKVTLPEVPQLIHMRLSLTLFTFFCLCFATHVFLAAPSQSQVQFISATIAHTIALEIHQVELQKSRPAAIHPSIYAASQSVFRSHICTHVQCPYQYQQRLFCSGSESCTATKHCFQF